MFRRLIGVWLLLLFAGVNAAPLASALAARKGCGCKCPRSSPSCCCRRSARGPSWSAAQGCGGNCHCNRAGSLPLPFSPTLPARAPLAVQPESDGRLTDFASLPGRSGSVFPALYQRPPPGIDRL